MLHILVIDDDEAIRSLLRIALELQGYQVSEAANGSEGLQCYYDDPADLVITDIQMPVMDGLQLLMEFQQTFPLAQVIAVSGEKHLLNRAKAFNIQGTFEKPFCLKDVLQVVRELMDAHATSLSAY